MTNQGKLEIPLSWVVDLIKEQFPQWADLPIRPVEKGGMDNRTFRLGDEMLIRLPSAAAYAEKVPKEQKLLPILAAHLSIPIPIPIPKPIAMGQPSKNYPWNWSIYGWLEGENSDALHDDDLPQFASDISLFLNELRKINTAYGLPAGSHNFWRGAHPAVYDQDTRSAIAKLKGVIDCDAATALWEKAISSKWSNDPVWIHGDFASGNILVKDGRLAAVIDFGGTGVGDPACDLVIAWTFLKDESRKIFKERIGLDADTWARARGWALWKATYELVQIEDKNSAVAMKQRELINDILTDANQECE
jgi:aminoglycoside phosphotransferase (APT) family kinase protein